MNPIILSTFLSLCICGGGVALALDKPGTPPPPTEAAKEAGPRIAAEAAAAIKKLGRNPSPKQIATIVFKAVRSSPGSVLLIVDAAVRVSPRLAATEIVTAATAAVRDPWNQVIYRRLATITEKKIAGETNGGADTANGIPMTLAEAIIRIAFDAAPGLSLAALQEAVNVALRMDPAALLLSIENPRAASGVGDAARNTYANEPFRTPKEPAVSR